MYLDELIGEVNSAADKSAELRKRDLSLQKEYKKICERNFSEIVAPYNEKMNGVVRNIQDKSEVFIDEREITLINNGEVHLFLKTSSYGVKPFCRFSNYCSSELMERGGFSYYNWEKMGEYFLTEEGSLRFVDALADAYCEVFEKFRVAIGERNKNLADSIKKLEDALKKSSAPKENEDGTVEFHINGKTYVGTVKEE